MKPLTTFFQHQLIQPCVTFVFGFWQWASPQLRQSLSMLSRVLKSARVILDLAAGLAALRRATSNNRTYLALLLICVAGPLAGVAYTFFDISARVDGWYYVNNFYLFYMLSPHLHLVLTLTGVFFLFPEKSSKAFFLIVPIGYHAAKILWLITVSSNDELNQLIPWAFVVTGFATATVWIIAFDYLIMMHYHKRAGHIARAEGILQAPNVDDKVARQIAHLELIAHRKLS